ncbi:MAG: hypothetical protein E2O39_17730 [Planctomycetota bacterium]|nr:MAG: hypothetical protein E2O39_17730 [Planctomycetota bacterium]
MNLIRQFAVCSALAASFLSGMASPSYAQTTPIANGHLKGGPSTVGGPDTVLDLTFSLQQLSDGSLVGGGKLTRQSVGAWILFDLDSYMFIGDTLYAAGPVTKTHSIGGVFSVGDTFFIAVNDNGNGANSSDMDEFIEGVVPAAAGPVTIQEILLFLGPAPPEIFRQGIIGNFHFH